MKKHLFTLLLVLSMLVTFVGTAAAAPSSASGTATLVSVIYVAGKGPVFTFEVTGKFSNADLNGALHVVGGADFNLYCSQIDSSTVKCTVSKKAAGMDVTLSWGGFQFSATVPVASEFCYTVYDYDINNVWKSYGQNCQEKPAQYGDAIPWYNPDFGDNLDHIFLPDLSCVGLYGDAYYYPYCPV